MASVRRSDPESQSTFDYAGDNLSLQNAPEPASDTPLLTANEHQLLNSFFEDMTSDRPVFSSISDGLLHSESWMDLPPKFMGSASFLSQHDNVIQSLPENPPHYVAVSSPPAPLAFTHEVFHPIIHPTPSPLQSAMGLMRSLSPHLYVPTILPHPAMECPQQLRQPQQQQPSADVLEAATVLQSGSLGRLNNGIDNAAAAAAHALSSVAANPFSVMPVLEGPSSQNDTATVMPTLTDMPLLVPITQLRWGSDKSFNEIQFTPLSEKETTEALENERLKSMECLEVTQSTNTTRASSPVYLSELNPLSPKTRSASMVINRGDTNRNKRCMQMAPPLPSTKRRKGQFSANPDLDEEVKIMGMGGNSGTVLGKFGIVSKTARQEDLITSVPKPNTNRGKAFVNDDESNGILLLSSHTPEQTVRPLTAPFTADGAAYNRGGVGNKTLVKPSRENLSEEQKRENHIKSEQKRRTLIREGFDDLCLLVPSLHGGGFSKSLMLAMAADWLEGLVQGNELLHKQLHQL